MPHLRQALRRTRLRLVGLTALMLAMMQPAAAQTWRWQYVTHTPNSPPLTAQSTVILSATDVQMTYTVPIEKRQAVIASCRAALGDIAQATTVRTAGSLYLLVRLKPERAALCDSGRRPGVALPSDDYRLAVAVAAAINAARPAAHAAALATATPRRVAVTRPSPTPAPTPRAAVSTPTPAPVPSPSPSRSPLPTIRLEDWVENEGLFSFIRVRNSGREAVTITRGEVVDCQNVNAGCGPVTQRYTLDPGGAVTLATVVSADQGKDASFAYRYAAAHGASTLTGAGSSTKSPRPHARVMSERDIRAAEAVAIVGLRGPTPPTQAAPPRYVPPRLLKRGSSRLAIGETGVTLVRLMIAANGTPEEATIVSMTNRRLAAAAIETAVSSTYAPAMRDGKAVAAKYVATFSFDGEDPANADIPLWRRSPSPVPSTTAAPATQPLPQPSGSPP